MKLTINDKAFITCVLAREYYTFLDEREKTRTKKEKDKFNQPAVEVFNMIKRFLNE